MPKDDWVTEVGAVGQGMITVRGYPLSELISQISFTDAVFLTVRGELPSRAQSRLMNAALCSILEHGLYAPTTVAARVVASASPQSIIPGIAAGVLTIGSITVSPQHSAELIRATQDLIAKGNSREAAAIETAARLIRAHARMPGLGHPLHPEGDPRAAALQAVAESTGQWTEISQTYLSVRAAYLDQTGRNLPINIDGMLGCVLSELGFEPIEMPGVAAISFMPGIVAHCVEEVTAPPTLRIADAQYVGAATRHLDATDSTA